MSKSPSLRRIQADIRELAFDPSDRYHAAPLENDMFEWHFTIRGADGTDFEGGVYHGRIMLPPEYPFKPPNIIFLTPSGRFETNTKVCLSFSAFHPELWQPAWGIRLILEALISFLPTPADGAIGALDWTSKERQRLAKQSVNYSCPTCGCKAIDLLPKLRPKSDTEGEKPSAKPSKFQKEIEQLHQWQSLEHQASTAGSEMDSATGEAKAAETTTSPEEAKASSEAGKEKSNMEAVQEEKPKPDAPNQQQGMEEAEESWEPIRQQFAPAPAPSATPTTPADREEQEQQPKPEQQQEPVPTPLQEAQLDMPPPQQQHAAQPVQQHDEYSSWMSDPLLHGIIVILAIICFLLMRKLHALVEELNSLGGALK